MAPQKRSDGDPKRYIVCGSTPKDRAKWQALYHCVGSYKHALSICDEVILWPRGRPTEYLLKNWALEIDDGNESPDPVYEKIMLKKLEVYKQIEHWEFISANIKAGKKLAQDVEAGEEGKQALALSYIGAVVNFGMDKGEHAQKQATAQTLSIGNVRIVSSRAQAAPSRVKERQVKKSERRRLSKPELLSTNIIDAVATKVSVLD